MEAVSDPEHLCVSSAAHLSVTLSFDLEDFAISAFAEEPKVLVVGVSLVCSHIGWKL
jgi:hypothetical protein